MFEANFLRFAPNSPPERKRVDQEENMQFFTLWFSFTYLLNTS